jgi:serine/threonine-protein kinase RIO1
LADLPTVVQVLNRLQQIPCPDLPVKRAEQRWAAYLDDDAARNLLAGDTLLHTDFNPLNVLMDAGTAWIIDWPGRPAVPRSSARPASCYA